MLQGFVVSLFSRRCWICLPSAASPFPHLSPPSPDPSTAHFLLRYTNLPVVLAFFSTKVPLLELESLFMIYLFIIVYLVWLCQVLVVARGI